MYCINFTYKSPTEDVQNCIKGSEEAIDVNATLLALRGLLKHNIAIIDNLMQKSTHIININPIGYGLVEIDIDSNSAIENLIENKVISNMTNEFQREEIEELQLNNEETNQDRLNRINNMVNQFDPVLFGENTDSESDTDDIVDDISNINVLVNKYNSLINNQYYDDSSDD